VGTVLKAVMNVQLLYMGGEGRGEGFLDQLLRMY
jgi:hypothetical protein